MATRTSEQNTHRAGENFLTYKGLQIHTSMKHQLRSQLLAEQDNHCWICPNLITISAHLDHNHETREIRGLLCTNCNVGLGNFKDDPLRLAKAIEYLTGFLPEIPEPTYR